VPAERLLERLRDVDPVARTGAVRSVFATHIEADGPNVPLGTICAVEGTGEGAARTFDAEVIRAGRDGITLSLLEEAQPTFVGARVTARGALSQVAVGDAFLGRMVDALGRPLDGGAPPRGDAVRPLQGFPTSPLERTSPTTILETGICAIDGLLTLGQGQRVGVFAASGVGKTNLMSQIASQTQADVVVLCLVGERGREVEALWNGGLSEEARARSTLVVATSDQSAPMRVRAGHYALALAEHWRAQGLHVLLLIDSVTRLAMAMREVGLAAGEPPTVRAYTPSVFAAIPRLVERCGALASGGAITALMTVLSETDDIDDPISEMMKSLLDGHILLSRNLAEQGHFPAIDVPRSVSRQAAGLVGTKDKHNARKVVEWLSVYDAARTLIDAGLHSKGINAVLDKAIERLPEIRRFLRQERDHHVGLADTQTALARLAGA